MFLQLLHYDFDRFVKLRIVALSIGGRIELNFNVRSHTMVFDLPIAVEPVDSGSRRGAMTAIDKLRIASNSNQPAPGSLPDERPESSFAEVPWQRVSS